MARKNWGGLGWHPDLPDIRDLSPEHDTIQKILNKSQALKSVAKALPNSIDLREWCSPIEDQGKLGSCTANAGVGLIEYFERRAFGKHLDASRLFLYKSTRMLADFKGDSGAYLRDTMKALVLFGVPPEKYHPYNIDEFDNEPSAFCYAFANNYKAVQYFRLDPPDTIPSKRLAIIKTNLAASCLACSDSRSTAQCPVSGMTKEKYLIPALAKNWKAVTLLLPLVTMTVKR